MRHRGLSRADCLPGGARSRGFTSSTARCALHLLLILIRNLLIEQDALGETRQLETLICSVMYGERRYAIDIDERAPLLDALMTGKPYEVKTDDRPSAL